MTEYDWLNITDPVPLLLFLRRTGKASERRCRLFACACVRRVWSSFPNDRCRQVIEVVERYADGGASPSELGNAESLAAFYDTRTAPNNAARAAYYAATSLDHLPAAPAWVVSEVVRLARLDRNPSVAERAARSSNRSLYAEAVSREAEVAAAERGIQVALLRDIYGNPFRLSPSLDPAWLTWNDGAIRKRAQVIYHEREFDRLPLLADALEEAGCCEQEMLGHQRVGGPHARGCWTIDLLLGRE